MQLRGAGPIAVMLLAAQAGAQDNLRTGTLVETIVTDKKGNYIRDLTAKDFRVWVNNKEQSVTAASLESVPAPSPAESRSYMLLLFDTANMTPANQRETKAAVSGFSSEQNRGLALAVAVYSAGLSVVQDFTSDPARIRKAIDSLPSQTVLSPNTQRLASGQQTLNGEANTADQVIRTYLSELARLARSLNSAPGRKSLVLLTEGFPVPEGAMNEYRAAVVACNRANVAIYPVDVRLSRAGLTGATGGLWAGLLTRTGAAFAAWPVSALAAFQSQSSGPTMRGAPSDSSSMSMESGMTPRMALDSLANETGGLVIRNTNDILSGLRKIAAESHESYAVAYAPPANLKAGCYNVRVKVSRSGTQVRSRNAACFE